MHFIHISVYMSVPISHCFLIGSSSEHSFNTHYLHKNHISALPLENLTQGQEGGHFRLLGRYGQRFEGKRSCDFGRSGSFLCNIINNNKKVNIY